MKGVKVLFVVAVIVCCFASRASAQGTVTWACGYPQAGTTAGTIVLQGTATPDCGWGVQPSATVVYWPECGGVEQTMTITLTSGSWNTSIIGLTPGASYNVVVQVNFGNEVCMNTVTVYSAPETAMAASCPP